MTDVGARDGAVRRRDTRLVTGRRLLISLLLAVAAGGLVFAFVTSPDQSAIEADRHPALVRLFPRDGDVNLRQDTVGVELAFGYTAALRLNQVEIPDDQVSRIDVGSGTRFSYTPGPGTETGALDAGRHCATVIFWPTNETRQQAGRSHTWCFTAA